jgi:hypothetical protein
MKGKKFILVFAAVAILAAGCTIEPLLHLRQAIRVIVKVLWKVEVYPDGIKPSGVTLFLFRDGSYYKKHSTSSVDSCLLRLEPGRYWLYMISQGPDEFGNLEFFDTDDADNARVQLVQTSTKWYTRADGPVLAGNPEPMSVGKSENFEITAELIEEFMKNIAENGEASEDVLTRYYTIRVPVNPRNIVSQYWVTIYSDNADLLRGVRASTTGMARSYFLNKDITGDDECVQIISDWELTIDDPISRVGHLDGYVTTFGFPRGELPGPDRDPELNVSTLLADNITKENYVFFVGNKITLEKPPEGFRHLYRLVLGSVEAPVMHPPDVRPVDDASGLNANVDEWGPGEDVEFDL